MTETEGVNEILRWVNLTPITSVVGLSLGSVEDDAYKALTNSKLTVLSEGWDENTAMSVILTPSASPNFKIDWPANAIRLKELAPQPDRRLGRRSDSGTPRVYDIRNSTFSFGSTNPVTVEAIYDLAWDDLTPGLQDIVVYTGAMRLMSQRSEEVSQSRTVAVVDMLNAARVSLGKTPYPRLGDPRAPEMSAGYRGLPQ
jgi:hypothetical protein